MVVTDPDIHSQQFRSGATLAALATLVPHRGEVHHGTDRAQLESSLFTRLRSTSFTGLTVLRRAEQDVGVLVHTSGRLTQAWVDAHRGAAALAWLRHDPSITEWSSLRVAHPILVAAHSLFDGTLTRTWSLPADANLAAGLERLPTTFTGTLAWTGARPGVSVYHGGHRFTDSAPPDLSGAGQLLQFTSVGAPAVDLLDAPEAAAIPPGSPAPAAAPPAPATPPAAAPAPAPKPAAVGADDVWSVTADIYGQRLGRGAGPAIDKLRRQLAGQDVPAVRAAIAERLTLAFGTQAAATFEERLGGTP